MNNSGYITYISNDRDIKAVLNLAYNLKKVNSTVPLYCICMEDVTEKSALTLTNRGIQVKKFNLRTKLETMNMSSCHIDFLKSKHLFGKFLMFSIKECRKFIYLDTDILILENIDHLFNLEIKSNIFMVPDMQTDGNYTKIILIKNRYNSGVIVSRYNESICDKLYSLLVENITILTSNNCFVSDQYIFELLQKQEPDLIKQLDLSYNIHPIIVESAVKNNIIKKPLVIHFMVKPKPWDFLDVNVSNYLFENKQCKDFFKMWLNMYNEMIDYLYFGGNTGSTKVTSYHWGKYNDNNDLEYQLKSI